MWGLTPRNKRSFTDFACLHENRNLYGPNHNDMENRRKFLKKSLVALTGAGLTGRAFGRRNDQTGDAGEGSFVYRTLGKTGIRIPIVSMGTGNCNNPNIVREALDRGVKLFATSAYYQNGNNEKMLGEILRERPRDSFMIMTGTVEGLEIDHRNGLFKPGTNPEVYLEHANECLKRLQVDHLDILSMGFGAKREMVLYEPVLKALETFKKQGKTRYLGLATHSFEPEAVRAAADSGVYDIVTVAYNFRRQNREEIREALQYAADAGMGIIAMKTMAGAYWDKEKTRPINTTAALKWVLQDENLHTSIPDCSSYDHLVQNLAVMQNLELNEEEMQDLELSPDDLSTGIYCQHCGQCLSQCPQELDIPTAMRSYMYAYGYRNLEQARQTLSLAGLPEKPCGNCSLCRVRCTMGFDVKRKILDIARIRDVPEDILRLA